MAESLQDFFDKLQIDPQKTAGMNATYQFVATGDGGGNWNVKITNGDSKVAEGMADSPTIVLTAVSADWLDMMNGKLNGTTAFLTGKLKIQGDVSLAMKLESLFNLG
ncbi:MAG TPA: SCP2 sterol-binding domain-containing protein [Candidatus Bathyarchaeia archaeon]|nr:SCP2 sterol-binding domain-containing protein [Candidatus Bathyarchaeia archaeon]